MLPSLAAQTVSPFPNPPEYAQQYTSDRIEHGSAPLPPPPLTEFRVFGEEYRLEDEVVAPLSTTGIRELYTNKNNWKAEMKKLNRSAVVAFFDLIETLIRSPDHPYREEKMNDLHTIFINMHHLINEFRPVQARDSVRVLQERQIDELDGICASFRKYLNDGRDVVSDQFKLLHGIKLDPPPLPNPTTKVTMQRGVLHHLVEKEVEVEEEDQEIEDGEGAAPVDKNEGIRHHIPREEGLPTVVHLLARQLNDCSLRSTSDAPNDADAAIED